jgi:hypothetical protein
LSSKKIFFFSHFIINMVKLNPNRKNSRKHRRIHFSLGRNRGNIIERRSYIEQNLRYAQNISQENVRLQREVQGRSGFGVFQELELQQQQQQI